MTRIPDWIKYKVPGGNNYGNVKKIITEGCLHTICMEAKCPNIAGCFNSGTATFLILGDTCTRNCRYCAVKKGTPDAPDYKEPAKIASAVEKLGLKYVVITSVTRDDLTDGGASFFSAICREINEKSVNPGIELLVPDFNESMKSSIDLIAESQPHVLNHNIETVKSRFRELRPMGNYNHSIDLLKYSSIKGLTVKSGLMIGFGESLDQIKETLAELADSGCSIVTVGQYLKSSKENYDVRKYYHPDEFMEIEKYAIEAGIKKALCGPLVRSSYKAMDVFNELNMGSANVS